MTDLFYCVTCGIKLPGEGVYCAVDEMILAVADRNVAQQALAEAQVDKTYLQTRINHLKEDVVAIAQQRNAATARRDEEQAKNGRLGPALVQAQAEIERLRTLVGDFHTFRHSNPEKLCPICHFPAWTHDPATAMFYRARIAFAPPPNETLNEKLTRMWRAELAQRRPRHLPGDPHQYELTCKVCGQNGTIRVTIDPEKPPVPGEEADHG